MFSADGSIGLIDFGCVKEFDRATVRTLRRSFLYSGSLDSPEFQAIIQEQFGRPGRKMPAANRRAVADFSERFYRKVYPPDPADDGTPFDFSQTAFLRDFARAATDMARARVAVPQYVFLARAEIGLYQTLHRLRARVHTSAILRRLLKAT